MKNNRSQVMVDKGKASNDEATLEIINKQNTCLHGTSLRGINFDMLWRYLMMKECMHCQYYEI